jgi:hypothetical protein
LNPEKLPASKRNIGTEYNLEIEATTQHTDDYAVEKLDIKYTIIDTKSMKTYSDDSKVKATISAVEGTLIEFQIPEINFRGNNVRFEADNLKEHGIMIAQNTFNVVSEPKTDKVQLLDDLYGQSVENDVYTIHKCDMVITKDIKMTCKKSANNKKYQYGKLTQLAQVNTLHGIYTAFESGNTANKAEIPIAVYTKENHEKKESLEFKLMDFSKEFDLKDGKLGKDKKPDLVSMGIGKKSATVFAVLGGIVSRREIDDNEGTTKETLNIKDYIPSFKGKTCTPKEISKTDFYNEKNELKRRAHITYECDGIKTIVDWREKNDKGKPDVREILNYNGTNDVKTCVTKGGILELNTKEKTLQIRSSTNGELIDYALSDYGYKTVTELICDHPGEGHALVEGTNAKDKVEFMMINLSVRDPLGLVFHKFESPVAELGDIHSSRYMNYFLLTFTDKKTSNKHYMLLNPGNKEVRVEAKNKPYDIVFKAFGHKENEKNEFMLTMTINGQKVKEASVEQFKGQYTEFNEKRRYDLDHYLKYNGPVETVDVIIPDKLKSMVTYENSATKKRIEILKPSPEDPDITIVIPSA